MAHEYKYLGIDCYSHDYFEPSIKRRRTASMKVLMDTLRKEAVIGVTCWELKFHLFKALVLPTFIYGNGIQGDDLKNFHWKVFKKGMKMHMMSRIKVCSSTIIFASQIWRTSHRIIHSQAHYGLSWLVHLSPSWLVNNNETSLSQHPEDIMGSISLGSP